MFRSPLPWLILGAVLVAALLSWLTLTRGGGRLGGAAPASEHHPLAPFHEIEIGGTAEIIIVQGPVEAIDIDAAPRTVVNAEVANGRLLIHARDRKRWWNRLLGHRSGQGASIIVHVKTLDKLALTGNVQVSLPKLSTSALRIGASGGATLVIVDLQASTLRVDGSGALKADIAGHVDDEQVFISGAGTYRAERLRATNATVNVSGVGNVVVNVERKLRANISGAGLIEYVGDPEVIENVNGIGRVRRRETSTSPGMRVAETIQDAAEYPERISSTRQSRNNVTSIATTSFTGSYG
jgi:hypothetical protein